jgi:hypothetical protein
MEGTAVDFIIIIMLNSTLGDFTTEGTITD